MIYLDNNATTPIAPEVLEAMMPYLTLVYGNPSSVHDLGRAPREAVEDARASVAQMLGAADPDEIVFTSGGTESDNWAIMGALAAQGDKDHVITTAVEHEAVRNLCSRLEHEGKRVTRLAVDNAGAIDLDQLRSSLTPKTAVVSIMHANNETGVLFPVAEAAAVVKENSDALFHSDGVNAAGKVPIDLKETQVDMYSISGHKFHAPKGIGALYIRNGTRLSPWFAGGGQESGRRAGTEAVHQIAGLGAAADLFTGISGLSAVHELRDRLENKILEIIPNSRLNGTPDPALRLPNTSNISFENTNGEMILAHLNSRSICVSTGSACAAADHKASPVLAAMDVPYSYAMGSIRFSLSRYTSAEEIDRVIEVLPEVIAALRAIG